MIQFFKSGKFSFLLSLVILAIFNLICGTMFIASPVTVMAASDILLSAVIIVLGIYLVVDYLFMSKAGQNLALGLSLILLGCLIGKIPGLYSALSPMFWSFAIIFGGCSLFQSALELRKMKFDRWWIVLIFSVITLILGSYCLRDPLEVSAVSTQFVGFSLLADAAFDIAATVFVLLFVKSSDFNRIK